MVRRALPISEPMASCLADALASGAGELPILPEAAQRILQSGTDELELKELSKLIHRDQSLATHVLRIANSPAFFAQNAIVSLQQAVVRLGFAQLKQIVITIALRSRVFEGGPKAALARALFRHSASAGGFAKEVARARRANVEEAFLAGLLHDVGKPVVLYTMGQLERTLRVQLRDEEVQAALDILHTDAGELLAERWSLPGPVKDAILYHHQPEHAASRETTWTTALADRLAHLAAAPAPEPQALEQDPAALALNLYPEDVATIFDKRVEIGRFVEAFG